MSNPRILTCVYCGHQYPQGTPAAGDKVLTDHIRECEKHPMRAVVEQNQRLRKALSGVIGCKSQDELRQMEAGIRLVCAPDQDKTDILNAIHVLLEPAA